MKRFERQFMRPVYDAIKSQIDPVVKVLKEQGPEQAINAIDKVVLNEEIGAVVMDLYQVVGVFFANDIVRQLKREEKGFGFNAEWIRRIVEFFAQYLLSKVVIPITETTKAIIMQYLQQGITEGWGADKIAFKLESPELTLWRARMITRTEAIRAMNYGSLIGETKSNFIVTKRWIAAHDDRTRHSHNFVDNSVIDFDDKFIVPIYRKKKGVNIQEGVDFMVGPGDINASAGNVINCRCSLSFKGKRDRNGRLIRKTEATRQQDIELVNLAYGEIS